MGGATLGFTAQTEGVSVPAIRWGPTLELRGTTTIHCRSRMISPTGHAADAFPVPAPGEAVPFEDFMAAALYDPRFGYYTANIKTVGRSGDFSTTATLHGALGAAVARWARTEAKRHRTAELIEVGGGDGSLAAGVLRALGPLRRWRFRYRIVEVSPILESLQRSKLGGLARRVSWHREIKDALAECCGRAVIFSNELADAFPAARAEWDAGAGAWRELYVRRSHSGALAEECRPLRESVRESGSSALDWKSPPDPGQRVEVAAGYRRWLADWVPVFRAGSILTIDYGGEMPDLYHRRPGGTLRAYAHQEAKRGEAIYERPGRQDMTADVNFGDLRAWGNALGLEEVAYATQREFLDQCLTARQKENPDPALQFLMDGFGAGSAFKVLAQRKG